ncbi:MAG: hypothetical protein WB460_01250 [Candidatus Acidiferrales bacterium]
MSSLGQFLRRVNQATGGRPGRSRRPDFDYLDGSKDSDYFDTDGSETEEFDSVPSYEYDYPHGVWIPEMLVTSDREGPSTQTLARQCRRMEMMGIMPSAFERDADFSVTTPNKMIDPKTIHILQVDIGVLQRYHRRMSRAPWAPPGARKLGFLVTHGDDDLLGIIALTSPKILSNTALTNFLFPNAKVEGWKREDYGRALRPYLDLSVCVAAQPIGWHWNIGKLLAILAYQLPFTAGYHIADVAYQAKIEDRGLDGDLLRGIITMGYWGPAAQYNRIYKFLGYTSGVGHEGNEPRRYAEMVATLKAHNALPKCDWGSGSNAKMRRIAAYRKLTGDKTVTLFHGRRKAIYYHDVVDPSPSACLPSQRARFRLTH